MEYQIRHGRPSNRKLFTGDIGGEWVLGQNGKSPKLGLKPTTGFRDNYNSL